MKTIYVLLCASSLLAGCGTLAVEPWQKGALAQPAMQADPAPLLRAGDEHIQFSREGSAGGRGFSAGGCGCN